MALARPSSALLSCSSSTCLRHLNPLLLAAAAAAAAGRRGPRAAPPAGSAQVAAAGSSSLLINSAPRMARQLTGLLGVCSVAAIASETDVFTSPEVAKSFDFTNEERIYKW